MHKKYIISYNIQSASRAWYVLRYFGFVNVRILNGGYGLWSNAGLEGDKSDNKAKPSTNLSLKPSRPEVLTRPTQFLENFQSERSKYIDTRLPDIFKKGNIPRPINIPSEEFLKPDARFISVKEIRNLCINHGLDATNNTQHIILYSSRNISACVGYFAMSMAGFDRIAVYDQGYENWLLNKDQKLTIDQQEAFSR